MLIWFFGKQEVAAWNPDGMKQSLPPPTVTHLLSADFPQWRELGHR